MSFFPPTIYPDGSFTQYQAVQPPPHPCSGSHHVALPAQSQAQSSPYVVQDYHNGVWRALGTSTAPRPCVPPHGPCPGPIPPCEDPHYSARINRRFTGSVPISHSAQQGLPLPNTLEHQYSAFPPRYIPASPPGYKPLPSPSEGTLLLAPPPSFLASTCPYLQSAQSPNELPTHTCPHCYHHTNVQQAGQMDWMISLLIILNFFVWGAVAYGYWCEYNGGQGIEWGNWVGSCVGGQGAAGWGKICMGEDCQWAFVDC